nr:topoisomerase DNA-binding C4 zinc finger domain-containing protein [Aquisalimonas sp. 2447]
MDEEGLPSALHAGEPQPKGADAPPPCPKCSAAMERKTIRKGAKAGHSFWGCSAYPTCRGIRPI